MIVNRKGCGVWEQILRPLCEILLAFHSSANLFGDKAKIHAHILNKGDQHIAQEKYGVKMGTSKRGQAAFLKKSCLSPFFIQVI